MRGLMRGLRPVSRNVERKSCLPKVRWLNINHRSNLDIPYNTGQATHESREHYLPIPGNLTPGISAMEYFDRRLELSKRMPPSSLAILVGNVVQYSSGSVFYDFQQDNNLFYFTGWLEPNSVAIIEKHLDRGNDEDVLFHMLVPPKNPRAEIWEGERLGLEGAYDYFNTDNVDDIANIKSYFSKLLSRNSCIFWDDKSKGTRKNSKFDFSSFFNISNYDNNTAAVTVNDIISRSFKTVKPLEPITTDMRSIKSQDEINVMHAAAQISSRAINKAIGKVGSPSPLLTERTLGKYLDYQFVKGGCDKQAYIPVVASGPNSLIIHYTRNDDLLYKDEVVCIDAGGKLGGYCSDISRAWPNSSKGFSQPQLDIYEVVLNANKRCIDMCFESNNISLNEVHEISVNELTRGLRNLPGFESVLEHELSAQLYPHYIGHHLGLDLHDIPGVSRYKSIQAGNVLTIEPGLYIPFSTRYPEWYRGIGVRIEDDVVVGKYPEEVLNLSSGCAKEVADIQSLVKNGISTPGIENELVVLDI